MIYLASPYSHPCKAVREARYMATKLATARLMRQGLHVWSPIVYSHLLAYSSGWDHAKWMQFDLDVMHALATKVWVYRLPGWESSDGVRQEMDIARALAIPRQALEPTEDELDIIEEGMAAWKREQKP